MADSPPRPLCDYCDSAPALLYCRADSAKLCFACDREVHATNPLFAKHARARLCDACAHAPAAIFCSAETSVLCHDCDWESHGRGLGQSHDRRPLEGFNGCPSVSELLAILGFEGFDKKALLFGDGENGGFCGSEIDDFLVWDVPCSVGLDDLLFSDSSRSFQAMGVPPLPKNRNAVCGQRKDEVLGQLRELAKTEHDSNYENAFVDSVISFEAIVPEQNVQPGRICIDSRREAKEEANTLPPSDSEARLHQWFVDGGDSAHQDLLPKMSMRSHLQESYRDSEKHADVGDSLSHANNDNNEQPQHQIDSKAESDLHKVAPYELTSQERETAISRYKEKKKTRRFEKRIRYESRKVRAESRTRVKGRFAKIEH